MPAAWGRGRPRKPLKPQLSRHGDNHVPLPTPMLIIRYSPHVLAEAVALRVQGLLPGARVMNLGPQQQPIPTDSEECWCSIWMGSRQLARVVWYAHQERNMQWVQGMAARLANCVADSGTFCTRERWAEVSGMTKALRSDRDTTDVADDGPHESPDSPETASELPDGEMAIRDTGVCSDAGGGYDGDR